ncbi:hypothetical protein BAL199_19226 [alpha proteobacterium BAL199]|jgi:hypothetical protein|nr:hypothetical protein BAL199_19226 [alpha proteobacterium BAL199]
MLKKSLSFLAFAPFLLAGAPATASAAQIDQSNFGSDAKDADDETSIPTLMYRRDSVKGFFCRHD